MFRSTFLALTAAAGLVGLNAATPTVAQAKGPHGGGSHGHAAAPAKQQQHPGSHGVVPGHPNSHPGVHNSHPGVHNSHPGVHNNHPGNHQTAKWGGKSRPRGFSAWSKRCRFAKYGCFGYYCPEDGTWYYWYEPFECYLPVSYMDTYPPSAEGNDPSLPPGASALP